MNKIIRWGILGCGKIARKFAADLRLVKDATLQVVASRDEANAAAFAKEFNAAKSYGSYSAMLESQDVDVIYIATPHGLHYEHVMLCLEYGKAVLCEKAFALNATQAKAMIDKARKKNVFLMEALWSKFIPSYKKLISLKEEGALGNIKSVLINFGFIPQPPVAKRIYDPALGGGTLLDIGIYNVFYALSVLGKPDSIEASITPASTGVDEQCAILFKYNNGALAQLFSSYASHLATEADFSGDKGRVRLTHRFYTPDAALEFYPDRADSKQIIPLDKTIGFGYHYEATHGGECLRQGLTESVVMTHADTTLLMQTLDEIRSKSLGFGI
ncbi:MAG: Gfo/Idh/MocA family oxidoreductase [Chitinophagaceae bacterium]|nr:Gfo/Idh/MocA family oxidoreductase [Chitinophagaceae bacterium]